MKRLVSFILVYSSVVSAVGAHADEVSLYGQLSSSSSPLVFIDSLDESQKLVLKQEVNLLGIPENLSLDIKNTFTIRKRSLYNGFTDLVQSAPELLNCVYRFGVVKCQKAFEDASTASDGAAAWFPAISLHNGAGDAFRHCWWSGLMYRHLGQGPATGIAEDHEAFNPSTEEEYLMDTYNNMKGRVSGLNSSTDYGSRNICLDWARNGGLVTIS